MDLQSSLAVSNLSVVSHADAKSAESRRNSKQIAQHVFSLAASGRARLEGSPESWRQEWLESETFVLLDVPVHYIACPTPTRDRNKVLAAMRASASSTEPIVVDMNKRQIGKSHAGYYPPVIVLDGSERHTAARLQGRQHIRAWVGELAVEALKLEKEHPKRGNVQAQAEMENIVGKFKRFQSTSIEAAMQIFGAAGGGMGGPGSSLGNGSGPAMKLAAPGPSMVMKPTAMPGSTGMKTPTMRSYGTSEGVEKAWDSRGRGNKDFERARGVIKKHYGLNRDVTDKEVHDEIKNLYRTSAKGTQDDSQESLHAKLRLDENKGRFEASRKMRADVDINHKSVDLHEKMPKRKNPADEIDSSGYYGYPDATDTQRQRMRAPKGSEFEDPKTRHKGNYTSQPDIVRLKGSAAKVAKIITHYKAARKAGYKPRMEAVAPPGGEHVVQALKKHFGKGSSSPFAIAWWLHNKKKK